MNTPAINRPGLPGYAPLLRSGLHRAPRDAPARVEPDRQHPRTLLPHLLCRLRGLGVWFVNGQP